MECWSFGVGDAQDQSNIPLFQHSIIPPASLHKDEFIAVEQRPAKDRQAMPRDERLCRASFLRVRQPAIGKLECQAYLGFRIFARFPLQSRGEKPSLLQDEIAVQQIQRLKGRSAAHPLGRDLPAVRTIERAENSVLLHAYFSHINHATPFGRSEFLFRVIDTHVIIIRFERAEARAASAYIEFAAYEQNRVAQRLSLQPL